MNLKSTYKLYTAFIKKTSRFGKKTQNKKTHPIGKDSVVRVLFQYPLFTFVFSFGCHAAAYVTLLLIFFQNLFNLLIKLRIFVFQPFGNVFMYGRFAYFKHLCRRADSGARIKYVFAQYLRSVLCRLFHTINSP